MSRIAVVTDSAACLPAPLVQEYNIHVVPFGLVWNNETLRDGLDITPEDFYRRLRIAKQLPSTSQPTVGDFIKVYLSLTDEFDGIVSIHIPESLSGICNGARIAAETLGEVPVRVVDSGTAAMAEGFVVLAAAEAAARGAGLDQVAQAAEDMARRVRLLAALQRLDFLARSGRVPAVVALLGSALHIVPVFTIRQGDIDVLTRARSGHRAVQSMLDRMEEVAQGRPIHAAVFHADALEQAEDFHISIADRFDCVELYVTEFTPVMGSHTGPGVLGVAFYAQ